MQQNKQLIIIYGPTGVGKSDFALNIAQKIKGEIINADVGQFYVPLSIGTAKPDWKDSSIPHHLFDILDEPKDITVTQYRTLCITKIEEIFARNNTPIIVGGSGFYIASLFFPPQETISIRKELVKEDEGIFLWEQLHRIDSERAKKIHPRDVYRLQRAIDLWKTTGIKPSENKPVYQPITPFKLLFCNRERDELYQRINNRVLSMMQEGWIKEVEALKDTEWEDFLNHKKLIGYNDIFAYLNGDYAHNSYEELVNVIAKKTRNYAKRQVTFWRMLQQKLEPYLQESQSCTQEVNLTSYDFEKYI